MVLRFLVPALSAALLGACATPPSGPPDPKSAAAAYQDPQPPPDEVIDWGPYARQFGELRLPDGDGPFPVVVLLHGGCWLADYGHGYMAGLAEAVRGLGFAVWTVGYRRVGEPGGGWPNTFYDVAEGTDYLRELARTHPIDPDRVIALGHSAGGQLALWLAARSTAPADSLFHAPDPLPIDGVVTLAAAADLERLSYRKACDDAATRLIGGPPDRYPERYAEASPLARVPLGVPQVLIDGTRDTTWIVPSDTYFEAALAAGDPVRRKIVRYAGHFELVDPRSNAWPVVRDALLELAEAKVP